ncbi:E3 ubiquitin-protein ligase RING1 [Drosophila teissieri]|uniref:E3 ubiquitin-protein ligase RING1 n=1 Tax=Drosophila teissieri TaxID=7243 RepID=UPI001CB9EE48|nr:E3 ubiquitin-protein ligase RING1 [Drosophila teissieri]XP_043651496.1 E3 ubiquitin-protein ligase RING1 [Drosophila teissieri]
MVYGNIMLTVGVVLVSFVAAVYFNRPNDQQTPPHRQRRRRDEDEDFHSSESKGRRFVRSRPGDRCSVCLDEMNHDDMHYMKCEHALHKDCFFQFLRSRRNCPVCDKLVNFNLPGDLCTICLDPLCTRTMIHVMCNHAFHKNCLNKFMATGFRNCPVCRMDIKLYRTT